MQEPIRILQIFTILNRGGAETNIMNYYRKLDKTQFQLDFAVHRQEIGVFEEEIVQLGGKIFRFSLFNPFKTVNYIKQISDFFDANQYQIIHGQCSELGYYFYKEAAKRNVPIIIAHAHNSTDGWNLKSPFRWFYKKKMMQFVNAYFSCSYEASIWLFGAKCAKEAFVMNNAIDTNLFVFDNKMSTNLRNDLQSENTINIVHIGRFDKQKNHLFLLEIFNELLKLNNNYKLFLIGIGDLKLEIENKITDLKINDKVTFLGLRNDVNEVLQAMDIFLFPSLFEGLPVSLIEAQSAGLQCFISNGVPNEAVLIPENVTVIPLSKSAKSWAKIISEKPLLQKKDVSKIIIEKDYDINSNIVKLQEKYFELLNIKK